MWKTIRRPFFLGGTLWWLGSAAYAFAKCAVQDSEVEWPAQLALARAFDIALAWSDSPASAFLLGIWISLMIWEDMRLGMDREHRVRGLTFLNVLWDRAARLAIGWGVGLVIMTLVVLTAVPTGGGHDVGSPHLAATAYLFAAALVRLTFVAATAAAVTAVSHALLGGAAYSLGICGWMEIAGRSKPRGLSAFGPWRILDAHVLRSIPNLRTQAPWLSDAVAATPGALVVSLLLPGIVIALLLWAAARKYGTRVVPAHF
ncbi:hypothetical protein [Alicyclobacillus sendaiensis]|uniref:ABC transporter permease n=1 Tax=Alicyclobacillus sendaiensis PA2 TaxID=3029425 RepID=A0ABT6XX33_ALISE|nr:hypothetical protein [Alicyclobacillus sendaiensis]MDI9259662.1 hypothetical protein [Alicyclobacillus sendaiensis PA2]